MVLDEGFWSVVAPETVSRQARKRAWRLLSCPLSLLGHGCDPEGVFRVRPNGGPSERRRIVLDRG